MKISIDSKLKEVWPETALLVLKYVVEVTKSSKELLKYQRGIIKELADTYELEDIAKIDKVLATREAYKKLGKSPSSYRNAAEAMLRRIAKGSGLYKINNVVDINNIVSITTGYSIGSYDMDKIVGDVILKSADDNEVYEGIGKEQVNVEFIPTLYDDQSAFGNPTSDSQRAMISEGKHQIMSVVYSFSSTNNLEQVADEYQRLLEEYAQVQNIEVLIIE